MLTSKILSSVCLGAGPFLASTFAPAASAEPSVPGSDRPTGVVVFPLQHANERSGARYAANGAPPSHRSDEHYVHAHSLHTHHDIAQGIGVSSLSGMAGESGADSANKQASNSNIREVPGVEEAAAIVAKNSASAPLVGNTERVAGFVDRRIGGQSAAGPPWPPSSNSVSPSSSSVSSFAAVPVITSRKDEKTDVDDGLKEVREETAEARTAGKEKEEPQESTTPAAGANYKSDAVQLETPSTDAPAAAAGEAVAEETTGAPAEVTTAAAQEAPSSEKAERSETEKPGESETEKPGERETEQPAASETEKPVATETEKPKPAASETANAATTEAAPEAETASTAAAAAPAEDASTGAPASSSLVTTGSPASDPLRPRFTAPPAAAIAAEAAKTGDHMPEPVGSSAVPSGVDPTAVSRKDDPEPSMSSEAPSKSASVGGTVETATGTASEAPVAGEPSTAGPTSETPAGSSTEAPAAGASSTSEAPSSSQGAEDSPSAPESGDEKSDRRPDKAPATTHKASESNRAGETSREDTTAPPGADTTSSIAAAVTVPCVDDPVFRDAQGHKCKEWTPEWCSNPDPSYSEADIAAVHAHCKKKCKLCKLQAECKDDDAFKDAKGYSCRQWSPADCRATSLEGYTKADLRAVRRRCRQSCELCGESGTATTTARPSDSGKSFDAYGALKTSESESGNSDSNTSGSSTANTGGENKDKEKQPLQQHGVKIESVATFGDLVVARVVNPGGRLRCCLSRAKLRAALITKPELPSSTSCEETSYSRTQQLEFSTTYRLFPLTPGSKYVVSCATVRKTSEEESSSRHRDVVVSEKVAYEPASTAATSPASSSEDSTSSGPKRKKNKNSSSSSALNAIPKELPSPSVSPKKNKSSSGSGLPDLVSNTNDGDHHLEGRIRDEVSRFDETGFSIRPSWKKPRTEMKSKSSSASSAGSSSSRSKYDEDDEDGGARKSKDSASTSSSPSSSSLFSAGRWIPLVVVLGFMYFVCWRGNVGKWLLVKMRVVESDDDIELTRTSYSNRQSRGSYQPPNIFGAPSAA